MPITVDLMKTGIGLLVVLLVTLHPATCTEENGSDPGPPSEPQAERELESHASRENDFTADSTSTGNVGIPNYCTPLIHVEPNGTYDYHIRDIYNAHVNNYTPEQQQMGQLCKGELSFGITTLSHSTEDEGELYGTNTEADISTGIHSHYLVSNWVVARVCIQPFYERDCAISVGIVELVKTDRAVFFYEESIYPGIMILENHLSNSGLGYVLNSFQTPLKNQPFVNLSRAHAHFASPFLYNSSLTLVAEIIEWGNLTCNYQVEHLNYSGLNHAEFLIEKIVLVVSLDHNNTVTTIPLGVQFQFSIGIDVNCSSEVVRIVNTQMANQTTFITEAQILAANYTGILKQMSDQGWGEFWRSPLSWQPIPYPLRQRCTLDPHIQSGEQLPECPHVGSSDSTDESLPNRDEL